MKLKYDNIRIFPTIYPSGEYNKNQRTRNEHFGRDL